MWIACIVGWIGWEIFVVLRGPNGPRRAGAGAGVAGANGAAAVPPANNNAAIPAGANAGPGGQPGANNAVALRDGAAGGLPGLGLPVNRGPNPPETLAAAAGNMNDVTRIVDRLAHMNLASESDALNLIILRTPVMTAPGGNGAGDGATPPAAAAQAEGQAAVEPSLVHRSTTFLALFVTSLVPAIWERRRTKLRDRERWVRDQFIRGEGGAPPGPGGAAAREEGGGQTLGGAAHGAGEGGNAQPALLTGPELARRRREGLGLAGWRKDYVERVIAGEAGDDDDM